MKMLNKKGFTIVELVVVIAIIAILAATLIPTFVTIVKKANLSNDQSFVKNMNTTLAAEVIPETEFDYAGDAIEALNRNGFAGKYTPYSQGFHYGYHLETNTMYLVDDNNEIVYPKAKDVTVADLWMIWSNYATDKVEGATKYVTLVNIVDNGYYATHFGSGNYTIDLAGHYINVAASTNVTVVNGVVVAGPTQGEDVVEMETAEATDVTVGTVVENMVFNYTEALRNKVEHTKNVTYRNCVFYNWVGSSAGVMGGNVTFDGCTFVDAGNYVFNVQGDSTTAYEGTLTVKNCTFINCARVFNIPVYVAGETNPGSIVITGNTFNAVTGENRAVIQLISQQTQNGATGKGYINITISDNEFTGIGTTQAGLVTIHEDMLRNTDTISVDNITFSGNKVDSEISAAKYVVNDDGKADSAFTPYNGEIKNAVAEKFKNGKK